MMSSTPNLRNMTLAMIFSVVGDHLSGIAMPAQPGTAREHLIALFMTVMEFYHESHASMSDDMRKLLGDMRAVAHDENALHGQELYYAIEVISRHPNLIHDADIRIAMSRANGALFSSSSRNARS